MANTKPRVLIVDDEPQVCSLIQRTLTAQGFMCWPASDSQRALELADTESFDVVVTDIGMPGISGMQILAHIRQKRPSTRVILVTGASTREYAAQAIMLGAFDYLEKPFDMDELVRVVVRAAAKESVPELPERAAAAMEMSTQVKLASLESVRALAHAVEAKDPYTRRHSEQVTFYAVNLAEAAGLSEAVIETIRVAGLLHDIGKIGVPDGILTKAGPLTDAEAECVRRHPGMGADILKNITLFRQEAVLVRHHHEDWNGRGYPAGLAGEAIPLGARVIRIADSMDAMLMDRTYRKGMTVEKMSEEMERCAGSQFDPRLAGVAVAWCSAHPQRLMTSGKPTPIVV